MHAPHFLAYAQHVCVCVCVCVCLCAYVADVCVCVCVCDIQVVVFDYPLKKVPFILRLLQAASPPQPSDTDDTQMTAYAAGSHSHSALGVLVQLLGLAGAVGGGAVGAAVAQQYGGGDALMGAAMGGREVGALYQCVYTRLAPCCTVYVSLCGR